MARIALIGPGALGGVIAARLARLDRHQLILCARRPLDGLTVETESGEMIAVRPQVITDPARGTPVDWIVVVTKAYDAESAATWFPCLSKTDTAIAIVQNGVEHRERFAQFTAPERIVPVIADLPAERADATRMRQRGPGKLTVGDDAKGRAFASLFTGAGVELIVTADLKTAAWKKLCLNAAGILSALLLQPAGVMRDPAIASLASGIVREAIAVGRAEGAVLEDSIVDAVLESYRRAPPDSINSLHADRLAGRPMETDARNGVIVRLGEKHGIATPYNRMASVLLETAARRPA